MLSKTAKYAVKALVYLAAKSSADNKIMATVLAKHIDVPKPFLSKIMQQLSGADVVSSVKGPNGGFYLTAEQKENSLYQIVVVAEGRDTFNKCILGLHECNNENPCAVHHLIADSQNALRTNLKTVSLSQVVNDQTNSA